ncbi:MAG: glycosyltransferase family 2 protein [Rhodospirillaceae bacterium]|nr:glycosyltransferase family 2 protein [Rhodospirillaceae bacterium]
MTRVPNDRATRPSTAPADGRAGAPAPQFSLVIATLGRSAELTRLLKSLDAQNMTDFEAVIVDQNRDDRVRQAIDAAGAGIRIVHLRSTVAGVCRNRNIGAQRAQGSWLLFPDDDCWYAPDFLDRVGALLARHQVDMLSGRPTDETGRTINGRFAQEAGPQTRVSVWVTLIEWLFAIRSDLFERVGGFDERIGPGAGTPYGSCEIQDLVLRCLQAGGRGYYDPGLTGHHPEWDLSNPTPRDLEKVHTYACGFGHALRKNGYGLGDLAYWLARPLVGAGLNAVRGRFALARKGLVTTSGRWRGWRETSPGLGPDASDRT